MGFNAPFVQTQVPLSSMPASTFFHPQNQFTVPPMVPGRPSIFPSVFSVEEPGWQSAGSQIVPFIPAPAGNTAQSLCQLVSVYLQTGAAVPSELLAAITTLAGRESTPTGGASTIFPIVQEPVTVSPMNTQPSTFKRDAPPHLACP